MGNARRRPTKARYLGVLWLGSAALASACSETPSNLASPSDDCVPASQGCACAEGAACDTGLACSSGVCVGTASVGFTVDPRARGCEVLLAAPGTRVLGVDFSQHVRGAFVSEAPRTAVSFIASDDAPIPDGSVRVRFEDDGSGAPEISRVNCIDVQGARIEGAEVKSHG